MGVKGDQARALFFQGYNCAQSVFCAFCEETGLPLETAARMASGFGGGFGRMREVCGCVSGMTLAAGFLCGYSDPRAREEKTATYAFIQALADRFREKNRSIVCRELLGLAAPEGTPKAEERTPNYYKKRPCAELAACAADILDEALRQRAAGM